MGVGFVFLIPPGRGDTITLCSGDICGIFGVPRLGLFFQIASLGRHLGFVSGYGITSDEGVWALGFCRGWMPAGGVSDFAVLHVGFS